MMRFRLGFVVLLSWLGTGISDCLVDDGPHPGDEVDSVVGVCIEPHEDSIAPRAPNLYLFVEEDSVVEEYMDNSTIPWRDPDGTYTMVTFYLPYCDGCKTQKIPYQDLSRNVKALVPDSLLFRSIAVSCHGKAHKALCREDESIVQFPTIRLYNGDGQSLPFIPNNQMHPFYVLQRLGITEGSRRTLKKQSPKNELIESETKRLLEDYDSATSHRHKQMLRALSILLRNVYESNKDVLANKRDPPLPENVAEVVHELLQLLEQTIPPATPLYKMVNDLLQNFVYIRKHQGWLEVMLDEHTSALDESKSDKKEGKETNRKIKFLGGLQYWDAIFDLLFTMAQGVSEWNDVSVTDDTRIATADVRKVVEQFALHAGWSDSRTEGHLDNSKWIEMLRSHENTDYLSLEEIGVSQHRSLSLWLGDLRTGWDIHVAVRHQHDWLDAGWPFRQVCEVCWERNHNRTVNRMSPYQWNEDNVYDYVRLEYGAAHLSPSEIVSLHEQLRGAH